MPPEYVGYTKDIEVRGTDEEHVIDEIIATMRREGDSTRERHGRAVRTSHAKGHGLVKGELRVLDDLAPELCQGLFAEPRAYPVIARLARSRRVTGRPPRVHTARHSAQADRRREAGRG